jgi:uridine kinase
MGMTLAQLAAEKQNEYKDEIILANVNGKLKELGEEYIPDSDVTFVTTSTSIGNETYRRSVVLLMLAAIDKIDRNILSNFKNYNKMSDLFNILNRDQNVSNSFLNPAQQKMYEAYTEQLNNLNL